MTIAQGDKTESCIKPADLLNPISQPTPAKLMLVEGAASQLCSRAGRHSRSSLGAA